MLIGILVSINLSSCGSDDDEPRQKEEEVDYELEEALFWETNVLSRCDVVDNHIAYIISDGEASIVDVNKYYMDGDISIPEKVYYSGTDKSYPVTTIKDGAFSKCRKLTSLKFPSSLKRVGRFGTNDKPLDNVFGYGNPEECGIEAGIQHCENLKTIYLSNPLETLCIYDCKSLTDLSIPEGTNTIGLSDLTALTNFEVPDGVEQLCLIGLPITTLYVPNTTTFFSIRDLTELKKIVWADNLKLTCLHGLCGLKSLEELFIPSSISTIRGYFSDSSKLSKVHCMSSTPPDMFHSGALSDADRNRIPLFLVSDNLYVPKGSKDAYKKTKPWSNFKEIIEE